MNYDIPMTGDITLTGYVASSRCTKKNIRRRRRVIARYSKIDLIWNQMLQLGLGFRFFRSSENSLLPRARGVEVFWEKKKNKPDSSI